MSETANKLELTLPSDTEIKMTRAFNAPRRLVFEAHTKPEHIRNWWGPRGTVLISCEIDLRVGGAWRFVMVDNGTEYAFSGVYREIVAPERLVNTEIFEMLPEHESVVTMTLQETGGGTLMTLLSRYESREVRDAVIATGMAEGAAESYDRMEELLPTLP